MCSQPSQVQSLQQAQPLQVAQRASSALALKVWYKRAPLVSTTNSAAALQSLTTSVHSHASLMMRALAVRQESSAQRPLLIRAKRLIALLGLNKLAPPEKTRMNALTALLASGVLPAPLMNLQWLVQTALSAPYARISARKMAASTVRHLHQALPVQLVPLEIGAAKAKQKPTYVMMKAKRAQLQAHARKIVIQASLPQLVRQQQPQPAQIVLLVAIAPATVARFSVARVISLVQTQKIAPLQQTVNSPQRLILAQKLQQPIRNGPFPVISSKETAHVATLARVAQKHNALWASSVH